MAEENVAATIESTTKKNYRDDIIDSDLFSLPINKDYYINAVDIDWYTAIAEAYKKNNPKNNKTPEQIAKDAVFYTEDPPLMDPGYYENRSCFVINPKNLKGCSTANDLFCGFVDGDTIYFYGSETECGDAETQALIDETSKKWENAILGYKASDSNIDQMLYKKDNFDSIEIRVLGIDCPEVPHVSVITDEYLDEHQDDIISASIGSAQGNTKYQYILYECTDNSNEDSKQWEFKDRNPEDETRFIDINGMYHELLTVQEYYKLRGDQKLLGDISLTNYVYVSMDHTGSSIINQGYAAGRMMHDLIIASSDARILVSANSQSSQGDSSYPTWVDTTVAKDNTRFHALAEIAAQCIGNHSLYSQSGFNQIGQELYGRLLGALYLYGPFGQIKSKDPNDTEIPEERENIWINAAKYLITQSDATQVNKSINGSVVNGELQNFMPDILKPYSYEYNEAMWADAVWNMLKKLDKRYEMQNKVFQKHTQNFAMSGKTFKQEMSELKEWTVLLGDMAFMVPPTSIRCISQTMTQRVPVVRAKGSIMKGLTHSDKLIEIHLFFNGLDGINGVPIETELPNNTKDRPSTITYYMNGLRALIAQFKLTPFLPIENTYINGALNINAVCFSNISINSVPGFPKLLQCVLTLRQFDPSSYMPQIPQYDGSLDYKNYFAECINYDTMRYYYQRPILLGEELLKSNYPITSIEYASKTLFANRTALLPYQGIKNTMDFYIADEDYLKQLLQIKRNMQNKAAGGNFYTPSPIEVKYMNDMKKIGAALAIIKTDEAIKSFINNGLLADAQNRIKDILIDSAGELISVSSHIDVTNDVVVKVNTPYVTNYSEIANLKQAAAKANGYSGNNIMEDNKFLISIKVAAYNTQKIPIYYLDLQTQDIAFIAYCSQEAGNKNSNAKALQLKQAIDIEKAETLKFIDYVKDIRIDSYSIAMGNTFTNVSLQGTDAPCPQYMGGQDIDIIVQLTTSNAAAVALLDDLPRKSAYLNRTYQSILPMFPVKIDSEFTRMIGVTEVSFDNIVINTIPNHPGLYSIQITMKSADRTLRNREALVKVSIENNEHITNVSVSAKEKAQTYFDLNKTISQVDLYPDLELPTVENLGKHGFQFIRYKNRILKYPDPDFYFIYPGMIMNEAVRESIMKYLGKLADVENDTVYLDKFGAKLTLDGYGHIDPSSTNNAFKKQLEKYKITETDRIKQDNIRAKEQSKALGAAIVSDLGSWDICNSIKVVFMESYYLRQLQLYQKNKEQGNKDSQKVKNGADVYNKLSPIRDRVSQINEFLKTEPVADDENTLRTLKDMISFTTDTIDEEPLSATITKTDGTQNYKKMIDNNTIIERIIIAALAGKAGRMEYQDYKLGSNKDHTVIGSVASLFSDEYKKTWLPDSTLYGVIPSDNQADSMGVKKITEKIYIDSVTTKSDTDLFNSMTEVGMFRIRFYTKKELEKIIAPETLDTEQLAIKDQYGYNIGDAVFTLDPYYRYASPQTIRNLKYKLMYSKSLGYIMFLRETLYWLKYMYEHNILPSISMDILRKDAENEYKILKDLQRQESELQKDTISESTEKDTNNKSTGKNKEVKLSEFQRKTAKAISTFMKKSGAALDYGKLFAALSLAITNGNKGLRLAMIQRNYNSLNAYVKSSMHPNTNIENADLDKGKFRKFILALVGEDIISEPKDIGKSPATPAQQFFSGYNQRKVLEAANDPSQWIFHSFYDMIRSDFRGRMVRAFPTFYMIMIDEGRNLGFWKLHDNFYNTNAITEIKIMKSRKIAADTAMVTMSNMFNTFTDQDEDGKYNYKYNFSDVFDSVFSPITYARTEEIRRKLTPEINRAKIRAGVRIHIRLGYGSDASLLPVGFNGVITEIQEGPVVQFLAQGDGIELSSPLMDVTESDYIDDIMCRDKLLGTFRENTGGQTPKTILDTLLTQRGDWLAKQVKDWEISRYFNENPYGIYHFGDMDYKDIIDTGEPTQNIYEVDKNPSWGDIVSDVTITTDTNTDKDKNDLNTIRNSSFTETSASAPNEWPPQISFTVANKSIWDIMNICASTSPEFISAIVPFGFRSSIFLGRPKYYYAYDYKQVNSGIIECRKPFSQYHMYYDTCDIIQNSVTASKKQLRTVVTGLYKRTVWPTITNCKVGPLHADFEIYPENQRSIMYDTQYIARNPWANGGFETNASKRQHDKEGDSSKESILGSGSSWSLNSLNPFGSTWQMLYNELIPDKAKNDEMSHIAWRMCAHKLKDCMKEMYQGQLLIIGDPSVKPYDRMFINDMYRDMNGSCLVRDVTHMFSVKNGFTTAITPDCISTVDDRDEYIVQSTTAKLTYTITRTLIIWGVYQLTVAKYAAMGGKTLNAAGSEIDKFLKNYKAYQTLIKGKDAVKGTPAKIVSSWKNLTKEYQLIQDIGVNIGRGVKFGSKLALRFAPLYAIYVATSCALAMFSNATKNLRVLKVFPLQHHGIPYTAGLDGNMNLVYGSPSDNQEGLIGELIGKIVAPEKGGDPNSEALNMFRELFFDEDTLNTASKFKHESGITDADGNPVCTEAQLSDLMKGMYKDSPMYYKGSSVELLKTPRCAMNDKREVTRSCADFRIGTIADFSYDSNISKSILLNTHPKLQNYFNSGFLRSVYTGQEFSDYDRLKQYNIRVGKQIESINGITEADNSKIVTIPFLNDDAVVVLNDIIRYSYDIVHGKVITNPNDTESCRKEMEPHYIVIKKAMSVGSSDLYSSSGFSFIIQGYGDILKDQLADIVKIVDDNATKDNQHLFMYNIYDDGEIGIAVALPKR